MLTAVERGEPIVAVARRFGVSERGLHKLITRCKEHGTIEPLKPGPKKPIKLTSIDDAVMLSMISALCIDGVIKDATMLFDGPMNAATFLGWVER